MFFWTQHQLTANPLVLVVFVLPCGKLLEILCGGQIKHVDKLYYDWQSWYDVVILNIDKINR